ncbi:AMP-dependent acyl-CoA synthetase [Burkholderia sp. MSh2]|uniref:Putative AMP-binding protein n=1 Tax=Burkholderia paludis TaxID=1506587 RepID=A0A6J5EAN4_9BURK|nr:MULTISPECIES: AMP-binding protein [Burkholderia]KEZ05705.1 AMP-dependent acyl-CoA synthetase [Burkholderia sp. MSh2]KFG94084.1 AMP-dependent acyl-CoA synthetase [Burkholderia paludis]CAB3762391.1 Long-chain-fatty-acid--CoA ligase [Burkholderia paludis]VWC02536.1 putative AMP-binding protein [Burkholderia paludis]
MRLTRYLDKGASLGADRPCLVADDETLTYAQVQRLTYRVARGLARSGVAAGDTVAILSGNDPVAFACVFGIARAGNVWCPINPRNEVAENRFVLETFACRALLFHSAYAAMVEKMLPGLPALSVAVCLDATLPFAPCLDDWLDGLPDTPYEREPVSDVAMLPGTGGTTGVPKGVMLSERNLETMTALTLMSYPFDGRPVYLAFAPLTHAAGVLCLPVMTLGGRIVVMRHPDVGAFLATIARERVTHTFLPPTVIYMLLDHPDLPATRLDSLQCFWYGAAPISVERLAEALERIGPMAQLFGQTEAPMMVSTLAPADHYRPDGSIAIERLSSAGRPTPLVEVGIMDGQGRLLPTGERGEIVVRGSLVMKGYYENPDATAEASAFGWHHTGDIGYLDADNFLFIVDRAKDMIITGGFNVYSIEVEQALLAHADVRDCAVIGLPDDKWGERVVAVVQPRDGRRIDTAALAAFVKERIGSVKAPKQIEVWSDLPRSKVGKVSKPDVKARLRGGVSAG